MLGKSGPDIYVVDATGASEAQLSMAMVELRVSEEDVVDGGCCRKFL